MVLDSLRRLFLVFLSSSGAAVDVRLDGLEGEMLLEGQ